MFRLPIRPAAVRPSRAPHRSNHGARGVAGDGTSLGCNSPNDAIAMRQQCATAMPRRHAGA